jgi:coproporphyrinogen III oxidase-like Fe-S oxidoreductase
VDLDAFRARYGVDAWARFGDALGPFVDADVLRRSGSRLALTREGMLVANEVMAALV